MQNLFTPRIAESIGVLRLRSVGSLGTLECIKDLNLRAQKDHMDPPRSQVAVPGAWVFQGGLGSTVSQLQSRTKAANQSLLKGPSTQYLRTLVPNTIPLLASGTRVLIILGT